MKIYFAGSIRGGRDDVKIYAQIIKLLQNYGEVLTEHIGSVNLLDEGELSITDKEIHDRDIKWLLESDVMVAEVTNPSLGVGYEIGRAIEEKKKVICLYRNLDNQRLSAMISGNTNITKYCYDSLKDLKQKIYNLL